VTWECVVWNDANRWRLIKGLEKKQFHVTTSPRDDHSLLKGIDSAEKNMGLGDLVDYLEYLSLEGLDEVCRSCGDYSEPLVSLMQRVELRVARRTSDDHGHSLPKILQGIYPTRQSHSKPQSPSTIPRPSYGPQPISRQENHPSPLFTV